MFFSAFVLRLFKNCAILFLLFFCWLVVRAPPQYTVLSVVSIPISTSSYFRYSFFSVFVSCFCWPRTFSCVFILYIKIVCVFFFVRWLVPLFIRFVSKFDMSMSACAFCYIFSSLSLCRSVTLSLFRSLSSISHTFVSYLCSQSNRTDTQNVLSVRFDMLPRR